MVLGLDGGTFSILKPLIAQGKLPVLGQLLKEGIHGELLSIVPPITAAAWVSFATGKNPGKHGMVDFVSFPLHGYQVGVMNSTHRRAKAIWNILSEKGKVVGIIGVPMTYPPEPVNGFMITDLMTPGLESEFTYPLALKQQIFQKMGGFVLHAGEGASPSHLDSYIEKIKADTRLRTQTALYLLQGYQPDFFAFVFGSPDPIQHQFWRILASPQNSAEREKIITVYQEIDRQIGEMISQSGENTTTIIMSDHGFGPLAGFLHLNTWLLNRGYQVLKQDAVSRVKLALFRLGFTPETAYNLVRKIGLDPRRRVNRGRAYRWLRHFFLSFQDVDWTKTRAFALGHIGQVYVNLRGRQPQGIVDPGEEYETLRDLLRQELLELKSPMTGGQTIDRVYRREEIYSGEHLEEAPDLILMPKGLEHVAFGESEFASHRVFSSGMGHTGHHRLEGILVLHGPGIKQGAVLSGARILDMAPTILYLLGCPIPRDMDGRILEKAFATDYLAANPPVWVEPGEEGEVMPIGYDAEEQELVRERLRGLGYIA